MDTAEEGSSAKRSLRPKQKKKKKKKKERWAGYVRELVRQERLGVGFTDEGMRCVEALVDDLVRRVGARAIEMRRARRRNTLTARDVEFGVRLLYPRTFLDESLHYARDALTLYRQRYVGVDE